MGRKRLPAEEKKKYVTTTIYCSDENWKNLKSIAERQNLTVGKLICRVLLKDGAPVVEGLPRTKNSKGTWVPHSITGTDIQIRTLKEGAKSCNVSVARYIFEVLLKEVVLTV